MYAHTVPEVSDRSGGNEAERRGFRLGDRFDERSRDVEVEIYRCVYVPVRIRGSWIRLGLGIRFIEG
jgi:hypothetical protein